MPELHKPRRPAQFEHLDEQITQSFQVASPELGDGAEIRLVHRGDRHEIHPLLASLGDPARRIEPAALGIKQQRHHHGRGVAMSYGRMPETEMPPRSLQSAHGLTVVTATAARHPTDERSCSWPYLNLEDVGEPFPKLREVAEIKADPEFADDFADATVAVVDFDLAARAVRVNISIDVRRLQRVDRPPMLQARPDRVTSLPR